MQFFQLEADATLPDHIREEYGSHFSFWEQLRMGGTGSRKLQLLTGPEDIIKLQSASTDTLQVSFQYLRNAFLIRYNLRQKLYAHIAVYGEIAQCQLINTLDEEERLQYQLVMIIDGVPFQFVIHPSDYDHFRDYFHKPPLRRLFTDPTPR